MCLGNLSDVVNKDDQYLVKILLIAARKAITQRWLKPEPPSQTLWMEVVQEIYTMEKMTFVLRLKEGEFKEKWDKWISYKISKNTF